MKKHTNNAKAEDKFLATIGNISNKDGTKVGENSTEIHVFMHGLNDRGVKISLPRTEIITKED